MVRCGRVRTGNRSRGLARGAGLDRGHRWNGAGCWGRGAGRHDELRATGRQNDVDVRLDDGRDGRGVTGRAVDIAPMVDEGGDDEAAGTDPGRDQWNHRGVAPDG